MGHKPINMKPLAMVGLLAASFSSLAAGGSGEAVGSVTFRTATQATVEQKEALSFGSKMAVQKGTKCTFDVKLIKDTDNKLKVDDTSYDFQSPNCGGGASTGAASKTAFENANLKIGQFEIIGAKSQSVDFKIEVASNEYLKFTPTAHFYPGGLNTLTEADPMATNVEEDIPAGTSKNLVLGSLRSLVQGQVHPVSMGTLLVLGELEALTRLDTNQEYELTYSLDVTYK